jgi:2-polyprenyl-6-methoxyphenol hydroxylase-like FAD-dependent oxidoreductase
MKRVAIIGGGFAGLAAGVELAARGFRVHVLEAPTRSPTRPAERSSTMASTP